MEESDVSMVDFDWKTYLGNWFQAVQYVVAAELMLQKATKTSVSRSRGCEV